MLIFSGPWSLATLQHDNASPKLNASVEIFDILIDQTDAARRHEGSNSGGLIGAMDAIERLAQIKRPRAKRVSFAPAMKRGK